MEKKEKIIITVTVRLELVKKKREFNSLINLYKVFTNINFFMIETLLILKLFQLCNLCYSTLSVE